MKISFKDLGMNHFDITTVFKLPKVKVYHYSKLSGVFIPIVKAENRGTNIVHVVFGIGTKCDITSALWYTEFYNEKFFIETNEFDTKVIDELISHHNPHLAAKIVVAKEKGKNALLIEKSDRFEIENLPVKDTIKTYEPSKKFAEKSKITSKEIDMSYTTVAKDTDTKRPTVFNSITKVVQENKDALIIAGKQEAGKVVINNIKKIIKPNMPMMIRGYADHAAFDMVVVTILGILKDQTQFENKALDTAYECAVLAATSSFVSSFDLNGIVEKVLEGVALPKEETPKKTKTKLPTE